MKSELLLRIKDAEAAASTRVAAAETEAKAILAEGRTQADFAYTSMVKKARKDAEANAKKTVAKGQSDAQASQAKFQSQIGDIFTLPPRSFCMKLLMR